MSNYTKFTIRRGLTEIQPIIDNLIIHGRSFICGGYARYCVSYAAEVAKAEDVDVYCWNMEAFNHLTSIATKHGFRLDFESDRAISYKHRLCPNVQIIKPMVEGKVITQGDIQTVLNNFDFTVAKAALFKNFDGKMDAIVHQQFGADEYYKKLVIKNIHCPVGTMGRIIKYTKKGYSIKPREIIKLFRDWENRPDSYKDRLLELDEKITSVNDPKTINEFYNLIGGID